MKGSICCSKSKTTIPSCHYNSIIICITMLEIIYIHNVKTTLRTPYKIHCLMIAELIAGNPELQEIASNTDCLLSVLAGFFIDKPNEDDEMINEQNIILYNTLRQVRKSDLFILFKLL